MSGNMKINMAGNVRRYEAKRGGECEEYENKYGGECQENR
jgi:hypothetical protein